MTPLSRFFAVSLFCFFCSASLTFGKDPASIPEKRECGLRIDFSKTKLNSDGIPEGAVYRGKLGVPDIAFDIVYDKESGHNVLKLISRKASGTILYDLSKVDLEKYPIMRWRWKVETFPANADGRVSARDDQGIAIYAGHGRFSQKSLAYRWETVTPVGAEGNVRYGGGLVKVKWYALRNEKDGTGKWYVEERNLRDELKKALDVKEFPKKNMALTISSNSQYTGTDAVTYLDYIEFITP